MSFSRQAFFFIFSFSKKAKVCTNAHLKAEVQYKYCGRVYRYHMAYGYSISVLVTVTPRPSARPGDAADAVTRELK